MCGQFDALLGAVYETLMGSPLTGEQTRRIVPTVPAPVRVRDRDTWVDGDPGMSLMREVSGS